MILPLYQWPENKDIGDRYSIMQNLTNAEIDIGTKQFN